MKKIKYTLLLLSALLCSCNQEEKLPTVKGAPLELEITAEDLLPADKTQTRITEGGTGGYTTSFSNDDKIGITVLKGGKIVDGMDNIPFTYNQSTGRWTTTSGKNLFFYSDAEYIAYYPHSTAMNGKKTINDIVAAFSPIADQSNFATGYSLSCLMTATGTANATTKKLSFTFAHQMAMLELQLKRTLNTNPEEALMADAGGSLTVSSGGADYTFNTQTSGTRYRMMLKPGAAFELNFTYSVDGVGYTYAATSLTMPVAGKYIHYDLKHTQTQVTLNSGSYEAALGDISKVVMDGTSCKAVKQTNNTYKITIPGNNMPTAISRLDIYIKDNLANNAECLLVSSTHVSLNPGTGAASVTLSKGGMEGAGTSEGDPYRVTTPSQLRGVGLLGDDNDNLETEYYEQTSNLDLSIYADWKPVKSGKLYDGKHYGVSNLTSTQGGIFSRNGGTIQNVHLASGNINAGNNSAGGITNNSNFKTTYIYNCSNAATITGNNVSGIVNNCGHIVIEHCKNSGNITATTYGGGIIGTCWGEGDRSDSEIRYCYNEGTITRSSSSGGGGDCGGIMARLVRTKILEYCYNSGNIIDAKGDNRIGNIVAELDHSTMRNCYGTSSPSFFLSNNGGDYSELKVFTIGSIWPVYNSTGWESSHWKSFSDGEHPKLIWEDQVKF